MSRLEVYLHEDRVGILERVEGARLRFAYDAALAAADQPTPLSLSLPVRSEPFEDHECRPFFAGLLPEGGFLRAVARAFGVAASNPFAVLDAIGGECAGAVSLVPPGAAPPGGFLPRWLEADQLSELLEKLPTRPLLAGLEGDGLRLSLAGAQEKLPVLYDGDRIGITGGDPPSTHIVKLPIEGFDDTVANEAFCLALARSAGLAAAQASARAAGHEAEAAGPAGTLDYLLVKRYDRTEPPSRRIHQEDLCQALGTDPELKYEADDGPGVAACAELIGRHCAVPARDRLAFADAVIFNLIIGNRDAHSKNFSLILEGDDAPRLAPLYDLLSTAIYPGLLRKMAMKLGGENRAEYFRSRHLDRLAADLGMRPPALRRRAAELAERVEGDVEQASDQIGSELAGRPVLELVRAQVAAGVRQVRAAISEG